MKPYYVAWYKYARMPRPKIAVVRNPETLPLTVSPVVKVIAHNKKRAEAKFLKHHPTPES